MKRHLYLYTFLLAVALLFTACSKDDDTTSKTPDVKSGKLEFPALRGGSSILITHTANLNGNLVATNYCVEWDTEKHSQRWSCYKMYGSINGSSVSRYYTTDKSLTESGQYPNDPDLPEEYRFTDDPYWGTGYDHGHICPSADRQRSLEANKQTFYMTNMQPQCGSKKGDFNGGIWSTMEKQVRTWAAKYDTLYVCKGGTIDREDYIIEYLGSGRNRIPVPRYFFMAVLGRYNKTFRATGFWINQEAFYSNDIKSYSLTIGELQSLTGIDFFHTLPDELENEVENVSKAQMLKEWY